LYYSYFLQPYSYSNYELTKQTPHIFYTVVYLTLSHRKRETIKIRDKRMNNLECMRNELVYTNWSYRTDFDYNTAYESYHSTMSNSLNTNCLVKEITVIN